MLPTFSHIFISLSRETLDNCHAGDSYTQTYTNQCWTGSYHESKEINSEKKKWKLPWIVSWAAGCHRAMELWLWSCVVLCLVNIREHNGRASTIYEWTLCVSERAIIISVVLVYCIRETRRTPYGHTSRKWKTETKAQRTETATKYVLKTEPLWNVLSSAGIQPASQAANQQKRENEFRWQR